MPDYTPNLNLYLPGGGGSGTIPDEIADIDKLNANFRTIDASLGGHVAPAIAGYSPEFPGQFAYVRDTKSLYINDPAGSGVSLVRGTPSVVTAAARDIVFTSPKQGDTVYRQDTNYTETYFELYNASTNPLGATVAGWYPVSGALPLIIGRRNATTLNVVTSSYTHLTSSAYWDFSPANAVNLAPAIVSSGGIKLPFDGRWEISIQIKGVAGGVTAFLLGIQTGETAPTTPADLINVTVSGVLQSWIGANTELVGRYAKDTWIRVYALAQASNTPITPSGCELRIAYLGPPVGAP